VLALFETYCSASARSTARVSTLIWNHGARYKRIAEEGADLTTRSYERAAQWFSDHWPTHARWPACVPRPDSARLPGAESGNKTPDCQTGDPVAAARAAYDRMVDAVGPEARRAAAAEAFGIGARLDEATGRIACPAALCAALGVDRQVFYDAIRRHRGGRPPRPGSAAARMFAALRQAGDVRFVPPPPKEAA